MVAPLAAGVASILRAAAIRGGATTGEGFVGAVRSALLPLAESGLLDELAAGQMEITVPVSSEAIRSITYHAAGIITVEFRRNGATYDYPGNEEMFLAFISAPSKGAWFNEHLR